MNLHAQLDTLLARIKLPPQDQTTLSFCGSSKASRVSKWAAELPATRVSHTSVLLYQALPEVNRLDTSISTRLEMLESLRPYVQQCIKGLAQSFLNKPLLLPEETMKTAVIAQALQKHMTNGYCLAATELLKRAQQRDLKPQEQEQLLSSLHRSLTGLGLQFLRSSQLYAPIPAQLWQEAHALYQLSEQLELHQNGVTDALLSQSATSCAQVYMRTLLLASARPNQLRQLDMQTLFDALEPWSKLVHLSPESDNQRNLFVIDLNSKNGPHYREQGSDNSSSSIRELDVSPLLDSIAKQREDSSLKIIEIPPRMTETLLQHITDSWGIARKRDQQRRSSHGSMDITVGLTNIHFHLSGGIPFKSFILRRGRVALDQDNLFNNDPSKRFASADLPGAEDPWANSFDAEGGKTLSGLSGGNVATHRVEHALRQHEAEEHRAKHPIHQVQLHDASPGGYCLKWLSDIPAQVKAGEILSLREPGRQQWVIGVIRWVRQSKGSSMLGVQLLSPQVEPYAIQQVQKTGEDSSYMRALLAAPVKSIDLPASILTTAIPFQVRDKVKLNHQGLVESAQLLECLFATSTIQQFSFRVLEKPKPIGDNKDEFGSDW